jgi:hypothetical protein
LSCVCVCGGGGVLMALFISWPWVWLRFEALWGLLGCNKLTRACGSKKTKFFSAMHCKKG